MDLSFGCCKDAKTPNVSLVSQEGFKRFEQHELSFRNVFRESGIERVIYQNGLYLWNRDGSTVFFMYAFMLLACLQFAIAREALKNNIGDLAQGNSINNGRINVQK